MLRIGIVGLGFMGRMHHRCWLDQPEAEVVAICRPGSKEHRQDQKAGNIEGASQEIDLSAIALYDDLDTMLAEAQLDAVSITVPSFLHADYSIKALNAGCHVLCEKPMALSLADCDAMITAADSANRTLMVGHCIRHWPAYAKAREMVRSGEFGAVRAASFRRFAATPGWTGWFMDDARSGGVTLDLHVHDADYIHYLLGMPKAVRAAGSRFDNGMLGHISATYDYGDGSLVTAEAGWMMPPSFDFQMSFEIVLERAALILGADSDGALRVCPQEDDAFCPPLPSEDGYAREIEHFAAVIQGGATQAVATAHDARETMRLVLAEKAAAESCAPITL